MRTPLVACPCAAAEKLLRRRQMLLLPPCADVSDALALTSRGSCLVVSYTSRKEEERSTAGQWQHVNAFPFLSCPSLKRRHRRSVAVHVLQKVSNESRECAAHLSGLYSSISGN
ncbi:hypothetical protein MRX96_032895 [Rhipicephalus microplus]